MDRGIEWYGDQFTRNVVDPAIARKMHEMGVVGVQYAQYLAPVRTGELRAGISYEYNASTHELALVSAAPWSIFVEFGTYKTHAQPFLRPALQKMGESFGRSGIATGSNLAMNFSNATRIKHPDILAHPRNATHAAIMRRNRATSTAYNYGAGGKAKQYIRHRD